MTPNRVTDDPEIMLLDNTPKRTESKSSNTNLNMKVHRSIIHNNRTVKTTETPIHRQMDKQTVVSPGSGMLLSRKNEGRIDTFYHMDKP